MSARSRRRHRRTSRKRNPLLLTLLVLGSTVALVVMGLGLYVISVAAEAPPIDELQPIQQGENSQIFAADGTRLGFIQSDLARDEIPIGKIPEELQQATIAIEDERFYEHNGVDFEGVARAAVENLEAGRDREARAAEVREAAHRALREAGVLPEPGP